MDPKNAIPSLEAPLISSNENGVELGGRLTNKHFHKHEVFTELKEQMFLAGPLVVVSFLQYSLQMISVMFIGHLGELTLKLFNGYFICRSYWFQHHGAVETFCGQAYGAKQYHMLGVHMQRAMLVLTLLGLPMALLWSFTEQIFTILKQNPQISTQAGIYARWLIPSIFPYGLLQCQVRFLQTQKNVFPLVLSTGIASVIHVAMCWTLVFRFGYGNKGAALSIAIAYWTNVLILAIYIKFSPSCRKTWTGFSKEGMRNLLSFLKLAVPSALMVCLEFWSYEFLVLVSGLLPNPKLETSMMSISLNACSVVYRIPYGFGSAASTRVANNLGAGKPHAARLAARAVIFLAVAEGLVVNLTAVAVRDKWGYMYSNEKEVVGYLASVMPVLATSNFMDCIQGVLSGVARGCGWQKLGAYVNLGAYYLVGLPCAVTLTFVFHFGGKGLWMGIIGGSSLQALVLLAITLRTNWDEEARKARERIYASIVPPAVSLV
ncbi:hypothetical protein FNV43_RR19684 [Rhamnella rubrinervis]|uniref:Protein DETOXIFICATION n=1 Tax=Rhamnella rubrinervis TaxID=2594499 RepID=A0A8K0GTI8_9ROSA|nr:hypothetical protein FNV43_RR19684 [Rhamnella rubrinervis]